MNDSPLWMEAAAFAARAHRHQVRKDGETPYASHTFRVSLILIRLFGCDDDEVLAAALLHDTIEDTDCDYEDLVERFGTRVADLAACLTKDMRRPEAEREVAYDEQLAAGPWEARLVKLADAYDNVVDAWSAGAARKAVEKARRAIALAEGDARLDRARGLLEALVARVRT